METPTNQREYAAAADELRVKAQKAEVTPGETTTSANQRAGQLPPIGPVEQRMNQMSHAFKKNKTKTPKTD